MVRRTHRPGRDAEPAGRRLFARIHRVRRWVSGLDTVTVAGESMSPRFDQGDRLVVRWGAPARAGDVVLVRRPDRPDLVVVKRAVSRLTRGWWVAGDNPSASDDSRVFGVVPDRLVLGRVLFRYWPPFRR